MIKKNILLVTLLVSSIILSIVNKSQGQSNRSVKEMYNIMDEALKRTIDSLVDVGPNENDQEDNDYHNEEQHKTKENSRKDVLLRKSRRIFYPDYNMPKSLHQAHRSIRNLSRYSKTSRELTHITIKQHTRKPLKKPYLVGRNNIGYFNI